MCGKDNSLLESILDITTQAVTGGSVGFQKGGFGTGTLQKLEGVEEGSELGFETLPLTPTLKKVTGAEAAEEANRFAREQLEKEKAEALAARESAKAQSAAEQLSISRQASPIRGRGISRTTGSRFSDLSGDERDFLGL